MSTSSGSEAIMKETPSKDGVDAAEAALEFATLIKKRSQCSAPEKRERDSYEVHPCKKVRGYTLKLPVLGWRLWYPTANAAVKFARRVAISYRADCFIYDAAGELAPEQHAAN